LEIYRVPVFEILKEIPTMAELSLSLSQGNGKRNHFILNPKNK
jgi:hypothetical protein